MCEISNMAGNDCRISGIYEIFNAVNGKRYIGQSSDLQKREKEHCYKLQIKKHSNPHLQRAYLEYGSDKFLFRMIEEVPIKLLDSHEIAWIAFYKTDQQESGYNLSRGGEMNYRGKHHSEATRRKISESNKGHKHSPETIKKIIESRKWYSHSEKTKRNIAESWKHNTVAQEALRRSREARKGRPLSPEHRHKLSLAHIGIYPSEETKRKFSKVFKGHPVSAETRRKISVGHKGIPWSEYARKQHTIATLKRNERSQARV